MLIGAGAFAVTVAVLLPTYAVPRLKRIPLDIAVNTLSEAPVSKLVDTTSIAAGKARTETGVPLQFRVYITVEEPSDADRVTLQAATSMTRADQPKDSRPISATVDRVTLDRVTSMPIPDLHSEIAVVTTRPPDPTPGRAGLQYKFPFDVQRHSYPFFDVTSRTTNPIDYVDDSRIIGGMRAFHFRQKVGPIDLRPGQPEARLTLAASAWGLPNLPAGKQVTFDLYFEVERNVWVEPLSGSILAVEEHLHRFLGQRVADPHSLTTLDAHTHFDQFTLDHTTALARDARTKLLWARYAPPSLGVFGVVLAVIGVVIGLRDQRRRNSLSA